jgi:methyltransferase (TIGR00027 family)
VRVALRSRFSETRLERAMERGVRQCIILGAGFDTFAFRQPPWARALRIFEVDHAATQTLKRARLAEAGIAAPPNVEFVTIDFERVTLAEGLRASSLDFSKPAFFSCLGVLMYLTKPAVDAVFDLVASFSQGSEIAFTFTSPDSLDTAIAARVREIGEPWLSHFEPDTLARDLRAKGFSRVEFLDLAETEAAFFRGRTDGLEPPPRAGIAAAVV